MPRPLLAELERRCQKPDHRVVGNWMARRVTRPLALRVTWLILPTGLSAGAATLLALSAAVASAVAFGWGSTWGALAGAALLQLWYLLDHVDGQLARYRGTESLDGAQLDYLMHHLVNVLVPFGLGWGLARQGHVAWILAGLAQGLGMLLICLCHDTRYKAFFKRLKRVRGELTVAGGGGERPVPPPPFPRRWNALPRYAARKACEIHVVMNCLSALAVVGLCWDEIGLAMLRGYLALMAPLALTCATAMIVQSMHQSAAEREFKRWFRPPTGHVPVYENGWWHVVRMGEADSVQIGSSAEIAPPGNNPAPSRQAWPGSPASPIAPDTAEARDLP
jgi:hypothetical protein